MKYNGQKKIKIYGRNITKETIDKLHSCICNHPQVDKSHLINGYINIKYHPTGEVIKKTVLIQIPIRKPHNDSIKPPLQDSFYGA